MSRAMREPCAKLGGRHVNPVRTLRGTGRTMRSQSRWPSSLQFARNSRARWSREASRLHPCTQETLPMCSLRHAGEGSSATICKFDRPRDHSPRKTRLSCKLDGLCDHAPKRKDRWANEPPGGPCGTRRDTARPGLTRRRSHPSRRPPSHHAGSHRKPRARSCGWACFSHKASHLQ